MKNPSGHIARVHFADLLRCVGEIDREHERHIAWAWKSGTVKRVIRCCNQPTAGELLTAGREYMGTWGYNSFENDDAMMWSDDLVCSRNPVAFIKRSFTKISSDPDAIDSRRAIAAAEFIATARGHGGREFPDELVVWLEETCFKPTAELKRLAVRAAANIREESELRELWRGDSNWSASCQRLLKRLGRPIGKGTRGTSKTKTATQRKTTDNQSSILRFIRENGGFIDFLERKPFLVGCDSKCRVPKQLFESISRLPSVEEVSVFGSKRGRTIRAEWLKPLVTLPNLRRVEFSQCKIGDEHLRVFGEIANLWFLSVCNCSDVSDRGLKHLSRCKALEILDVGNTKVTRKGITRLRRSLPRLKDVRD